VHRTNFAASNATDATVCRATAQSGAASCEASNTVDFDKSLAGLIRAWTGFPKEDLNWALHGWARVAPGYGGWKIMLDEDARDQVVYVAPPGVVATPPHGPRFVITAMVGGNAMLSRDFAGVSLGAIDIFPSLPDALQALCQLTPAQETEADALAAGELALA
jgi:hypothetical protein